MVVEEIKKAVHNNMVKIRDEVKKQMILEHKSEIKNLTELVANKPDRKEVTEFLDKKSNLTDSQNNRRIGEMLNKQIRHLTIVTLDLLRKNVEKFTVKQGSPEMMNEKQAKMMYRQGLMIAKWINKFNPDAMSEEIAILPADLGEFEEYVNKSFDEMGEYLFSHTRNLYKRKSKGINKDTLKKLLTQKSQRKISMEKSRSKGIQNNSIIIKENSPAIKIRGNVHNQSNNVYSNRLSTSTKKVRNRSASSIQFIK